MSFSRRNHHLRDRVTSVLLCLPLLWGAVSAANPTAPATMLGGDSFTPVGAQREANADGSIPAWEGGITGPIPGYVAGSHHADPFADDEILITITADNMHEHADKLSEGHKALLQAYPDSWYMNVYPSRRSAAYPDFVYEAMADNAENAELIVEGRGGVRNSRVTSPFPFPQRGEEIIWNHNLRWRGIRVRRGNGVAPVTRGGNFTVSILEEEYAVPYAQPQTSQLRVRLPYLVGSYRQKVIAPGFLAGSAQLAVESLDYNQMGRQSWIYNPDLRRVMRTPFTGYDNPSPNSDALRFNDEIDMFNGSPVLFDWKLLGKREMYIPYNAYRLHSGDLEPEDILQQRHINPKLARYELHRVWVVEGTVKVVRRNPAALRLENRGHVYSRRVFYIDEDSWQLAVAANYDSEGRLWRFSEGHMINYYQVPVPWYTLEVFHDLQQERYVVGGLDNQRPPARFGDDINSRLFGPNALDYYIR